MPYASVDDVAIKYGSLTEEQETRAAVLLHEAEAVVRQRVPDLDARIEAGRTSTTLVRRVLSEMVVGVLRNPEGYRTVNHAQTAGPFTDTRSGTFSTGGGDGLALSRDHLRLLGGRAGAVSASLHDPALEHLFRGRRSWPSSWAPLSSEQTP